MKAHSNDTNVNGFLLPMGVQASDRLTIRQYQAHTQHKRKKNVQSFLSLL